MLRSSSELWPRRGSSRVLYLTKGSRKDCPCHTVGSRFEVSRTHVLGDCSGQHSMPPIAACASPLNLKLKIESTIPLKRLQEGNLHYWRIALQGAAPSPPPEPCTLSKARQATSRRSISSGCLLRVVSSAERLASGTGTVPSAHENMVLNRSSYKTTDDNVFPMPLSHPHHHPHFNLKNMWWVSCIHLLGSTSVFP